MRCGVAVSTGEGPSLSSKASRCCNRVWLAFETAQTRGIVRERTNARIRTL